MAEQERRTTTRAAPTDEPPTPAKSAVAEKGERRRVTEKFIGYSHLIEACGQGGCLVCCCVEEDGRLLLEVPNAARGAAIIYENLIRTELAAARGARLANRSREG